MPCLGSRFLGKDPIGIKMVKETSATDNNSPNNHKQGHDAAQDKDNATVVYRPPVVVKDPEVEVKADTDKQTSKTAAAPNPDAITVAQLTALENRISNQIEHKSSGKGLLFFVALIALGAAGGAGFTYMQNQQLQQQLTLLQAKNVNIEQVLADSRNDIAKLESSDKTFEEAKISTINNANNLERAFQDSLRLQQEHKELAKLFNQFSAQVTELSTTQNQQNDKFTALTKEQAEQFTALTKEQAEQFTNLTKEQAEQFTTLNKTQNDDFAAFKQQQTSDFQALHQQVQTYSERNPNDWLLAESFFLVNNATVKVVYEKNIAAALWMLSKADSLLVNIEGLDVANLREAISRDVATLKNVPAIDLRSKLLQLDRVYDNVKNLALEGYSDPEARAAAFSKRETNEPSADLKEWKENFIKSANDFASRFVEVRRRNIEAATEFLTPDQDNFLRENIKTRILLAKTDIGRGDKEALQNNLNEAMHLIQTYFSPDSEVTVSSLATLKEIAEGEISVATPQALESAAAFSQYAQSHLPNLATSSN